MTRLDLVKTYQGFTSSQNLQDVFLNLCNYLVEFDPDVVVLLNRAIGKVTASGTISVPSTTLARASIGQGSYQSFNSSTL